MEIPSSSIAEVENEGNFETVESFAARSEVVENLVLVKVAENTDDVDFMEVDEGAPDNEIEENDSETEDKIIDNAADARFQVESDEFMEEESEIEDEPGYDYEDNPESMADDEVAADVFSSKVHLKMQKVFGF